jgi:Peptidase MA superfamily/Tetratricopeptide repeat
MKKLTVIILITVILCVPNFRASDKEPPKRSENEYTDLLPTILDKNLYYYFSSRKWREAVNYIKKLYQKQVLLPNIKVYLAYCYENLGIEAFNEKRFDDAINEFRNAMLYFDNVARCYYFIGYCHFSLSRYEKAEKSFKKALELKPGNFYSLLMLGYICYMSNRNYEALNHWQDALKVDPEHKTIKKKVEELQQLNNMAGEMETEKDMKFAITFNGTKKPQLRELVLKMLIEISTHVEQNLRLYAKRQIPVILLTNREFFDITGSPKWAGGVYEGHIKVPVDKYKPEPLKYVLTHEYIHAVIFDHLSYRCPWWLNEGLAQYFSGDNEGNAKKLKIAIQYLGEGKVPDLNELKNKFLKNGDSESIRLAYALALSAVKFFVDNYGINDLQYALDLMGEGKTFREVITTISGYSFTEFLNAWKESAAY